MDLCCWLLALFVLVFYGDRNVVPSLSDCFSRDPLLCTCTRGAVLQVIVDLVLRVGVLKLGTVCLCWSLLFFFVSFVYLLLVAVSCVVNSIAVDCMKTLAVKWSVMTYEGSERYSYTASLCVVLPADDWNVFSVCCCCHLVNDGLCKAAAVVDNVDRILVLNTEWHLLRSCLLLLQPLKLIYPPAVSVSSRVRQTLLAVHWSSVEVYFFAIHLAKIIQTDFIKMSVYMIQCKFKCEI